MSDVHDFPLFRDLSAEAFNELVKAMSFRDLPAGEILFRQGDTAEYVYVIRTGKVRISATVDGVEEVYTDLGPGELFGEMGAVRQLPRSATVKAVDATRLILFEGTRFTTLMGEHPSVAGLVLRTMRGRFRMDEVRAEARRRRHGGALIALFSASGGAGTSTIAAGLAQGLSASGKSVALLDLDVMFGDQAERFGLPLGGTTLSDHVMCSPSDRPPRVVQATALGVNLLPAPTRANHADFVDARVISPLVAELREQYDVLVVDTSRRVEDFTLDLLDTADRALYVMTGDPLTAGHARRWIDLIRQVGLGTDHIFGLVNQAREGVDLGSLREKLGFEQVAPLPDDPIGATSIGTKTEDPPAYELVTKLTELGERLISEDAPESQAPNWGGGV